MGGELSRRSGSEWISRRPAWVFERPMWRRPLARSTSRQSRLHSSCARGPARIRVAMMGRAVVALRQWGRGRVRRLRRASAWICSAVSRCTGRRAGLEAPALAGGGVGGECPYSRAIARIAWRMSMVLLIEVAPRGLRTRPCSSTAGLPFSIAVRRCSACWTL